MRKLVWMLLLVMMVSLFAGCQGEKEEQSGSNDTVAQGEGDDATKTEEQTQEEEQEQEQDEAESVTLKIAAFQGGFGREYWDEVAKLFEDKYTNVTVEVTADPNIGEQIRNDILADDSPDFVFLSSRNSSGATQALIKDKGILDITDVMMELSDQLIDGVLDNSVVSPYGDGKIYLAPFNYSSLGLWYNADFFADNGIDAPVTWEDFFGLQETIIDRALITYPGIYPGYLEALVYPAIASGTGIDGFNALMQYDREILNDDSLIKVLDNFEKIASTGAIMNGTEGINHTVSQSEFLMGKAAFITNGSWIANEMKEAPREEDFAWGFAAAPVMNENQTKYVVVSMDEMYIPKASKNPEMAKEFLKFLYSEEAIELQAELAQSVPPIFGGAEIVEPYVDEATAASFGIFDEGYTALIGGFSAVENMSLIPRKEFFGTVGQVITGQMDKEEAIDFLKVLFEEASENIVE